MFLPATCVGYSETGSGCTDLHPGGSNDTPPKYRHHRPFIGIFPDSKSAEEGLPQSDAPVTLCHDPKHLDAGLIHGNKIEVLIDPVQPFFQMPPYKGPLQRDLRRTKIPAQQDRRLCFITPSISAEDILQQDLRLFFASACQSIASSLVLYTAYIPLGYTTAP